MAGLSVYSALQDISVKTPLALRSSIVAMSGVAMLDQGLPNVHPVQLVTSAMTNLLNHA